RADLTVVRQPLGVAISLAGPPPARGETRPRRIREVDDDEAAVAKAVFARRGVRVPAAGVPDPMHPESVDRQEADPSRVGRVRHVVDEEPGALGNADAIRVLLVIGEEKTIR